VADDGMEIINVVVVEDGTGENKMLTKGFIT
jgi:hypothetical protein